LVRQNGFIHLPKPAAPFILFFISIKQLPPNEKVVCVWGLPFHTAFLQGEFNQIIRKKWKFVYFGEYKLLTNFKIITIMIIINEANIEFL